MKVAVLRAPRHVGIEELETPELEGGDLLVRMIACGVCGTDVEKVYGHSVTSPILGHEVAGEVVKVGRGVKEFHVGDRVFAHHHAPCYTCHYCVRGDHTMCEAFRRSNLDPGGLSEFFRVPAWNVGRGSVLRLSDDVTYEEGTFIEPLACCIRGLKKCRVQPGDVVMVIGVGPAGLLHVKALPLFGAGGVLVSDVNDFRLEHALKSGAHRGFNPLREDVAASVRAATDERGVDAAIVATREPACIAQASKLVRSGGVVEVFGAPPKGSTFTADADQLFARGLSIVSSYSTTELETNIALRLIASKRVDVASMVTHRFRLDESGDAIRCAAEAKDAIKVVVAP